jgi:DNA-binding transcriptional MerR regulator
MENFLTIGEFAQATRLSPKALRLYADHGLLTPARVDDDSGYRYYRAEQLPVARLIGLLRAANMPLREIRRFLIDPRQELLDEYERRLAGEHAGRLEVLRYVKTVLKEGPMFEVQIKDVVGQRYVSKTANVRIDALAPFITSTIDDLAAEGIEGAPFCVFHGTVNETDDGPVEVGVPRADGDQELAAGEVAFVTVGEKDARFPQILGAYDAIARWAAESGRDLTWAPREVYLNTHGEPRHWEVVWPLR